MEHAHDFYARCRSWLHSFLLAVVLCWICLLSFSFLLLPTNKFYQQKSQAIREPYISCTQSLFVCHTIQSCLVNGIQIASEAFVFYVITLYRSICSSASVIDGFKSNTIIFSACTVFAIAHFCCFYFSGPNAFHTFSPNYLI